MALDWIKLEHFALMNGAGWGCVLHTEYVELSTYPGISG